MKNGLHFLLGMLVLLSLLAVPSCIAAESIEKTVTDGFGRSVTIPVPASEVLCSGSGCLRYLTYLGGEDLIIGVDSIEKKDEPMDARGYAILNPQFKDLPLFGEFRGKDDPEKVIELSPQLVFKTGSTGTPYAANAEEGNKLSEKTGVPYVMFPYGSLRTQTEKDEMYGGLRLMGEVIGKKDRAEELIAYIEATIADLESRTKDIPESERKSAYVGGVSYAGAHGIISTEPAYPPFIWTNVKNVAGKMGTQHADVAKEAIVDWDPEFIFMDVGTIQMETEGGIGELKNDPSLSGLTAIKEGKIYGVLPYNYYSTNYENVLADAYYIGKIVYPDRFADIDPKVKADEIMKAFLGSSPLDKIIAMYNNLAFTGIAI